MAASLSPPQKETLSSPEVSSSAAATETQNAISNERALTLRDSFKLYPKAILFSLIFSTAIIMEGYDTNLIGNFYAFPQFKDRFGDQADPEGGRLVSAQWQTLIGNCGQVRI